MVRSDIQDPQEVDELCESLENSLRLAIRKGKDPPLEADEVPDYLKLFKKLETRSQLNQLTANLRRADLFLILSTAYPLVAEQCKKLTKEPLAEGILHQVVSSIDPLLISIPITKFGFDCATLFAQKFASSGLFPAPAAGPGVIAPPGAPAQEDHPDSIDIDCVVDSNNDFDNSLEVTQEVAEASSTFLHQLSQAKIIEKTVPHPQPEIVFEWKTEGTPEANSWNLCENTLQFLPKNVFIPPPITQQTRESIRLVQRLPNQIYFRAAEICRDHSLFQQLFDNSAQGRDTVLRQRQQKLIKLAAPLLHLLEAPQTQATTTCVKATLFGIFDELRNLGHLRLQPICKRLKLEIADFSFSEDSRFLLSDADTALIRETVKRDKTFVSALSAVAPQPPPTPPQSFNTASPYTTRRQPTLNAANATLRVRDQVWVPNDFISKWNHKHNRQNTILDWRAPGSSNFRRTPRPGPKQQGQRQRPRGRPNNNQPPAPYPTPPPLAASAHSQPQLPTPQY